MADVASGFTKFALTPLKMITKIFLKERTKVNGCAKDGHLWTYVSGLTYHCMTLSIYLSQWFVRLTLTGFSVSPCITK